MITRASASAVICLLAHENCSIIGVIIIIIVIFFIIIIININISALRLVSGSRASEEVL